MRKCENWIKNSVTTLYSDLIISDCPNFQRTIYISFDAELCQLQNDMKLFLVIPS
jgi:hypothetical protein